MKKVSVIIPAYNSAAYIAETVESVLNQSYSDMEIIIVDDGSTDNTRELVNGWNIKNLKYIFQENSGGPSSPRNKGIKTSSGEYIALFDADDIMQSEKIERAVRFLELCPDLGLIFTNFKKFRAQNAPERPFLDNYPYFLSLPKRRVGSEFYVIDRKHAYRALFYENFIGTSSVVVSRKIFENVGFFDETLKNSDDRDMWFRIAKNYDIGFIDAVGHYYRVHEKSISFKGVSLFENRIKSVRKQLEGGLDGKLKRQAHKLIASYLISMSYLMRKKGKKADALRYCLLSMKEFFMFQALQELFKSLIPSGLFPLSAKKTGGKTAGGL